MYGFSGQQFGGFGDQFSPLVGGGNSTIPGSRRRRSPLALGPEPEEQAAPDPMSAISTPPRMPAAPVAPARDAGGLTPEQRSNFYRSVALNNGMQAAQQSAFARSIALSTPDLQARQNAYADAQSFKADALTAPLGITPTGRNLALDANARQNDLAGADVANGYANAGATNVDSRARLALTPAAVRGANAEAAVQEGGIDPRIMGLKAQAQGQLAVANAIPGQLSAQTNAINSGVNDYKALQGNHYKLQQQFEQLQREHRLALADLAKFRALDEKNGYGGDEGGGAPPQPQAAAPASASPTSGGTNAARQQAGQGGAGNSPPGYYKNPKTGQRGYWDGQKFTPVG
jgi:hypothetical protein